MKATLFLLSICTLLIASERHIGLLIIPEFRGENAFARRIEAACKNLHWTVDVIDVKNSSELKENHYDFVISLVPYVYEHPKCKNYQAIFDPFNHYFDKKGILKKRYQNFDGYLLSFSGDKNFHAKGKYPFIQWYPLAQKTEYRTVTPSHLFYICCVWGDRLENHNFQQLLQFLDNSPNVLLYGSEQFQSLYPRSYQGSIPFDSHSLYETAAQAGVSLVLHSSIHNEYGIPSGRIFETAAASTVIISDQNSFVRTHFGDSVLYINTQADSLSIYNQIQDHMKWIQANPTAALEKAKKAHEIVAEKFLLEDQLLRLEAFHEQLSHKIFIKPAALILNPFPKYTLINSVDFHPKKNLFCATFTQANIVGIYKIGPLNRPEIVQTLKNPSAQLSEPQHAVFSPNGEKIVVANWTNQTLTVYESNQKGIFNTKPSQVIPTPSSLANHKPHGIAFSPCGKFLSVAYGAADQYGRAIALFRISEKWELTSLLEDLPETPKGITFSPDGTSLLVTFSSANSLVIYDLDLEKQTILPTPRQIYQGNETQISRPEDVKISPDGKYCAVSNSDQNTVTFYLFDPTTNKFPINNPIHILENLSFPHGIAFSHDGSFLLVSEFGFVKTTKEGDITWKKSTNPKEAKIHLYKVER